MNKPGFIMMNIMPSTADFFFFFFLREAMWKHLLQKARAIFGLGLDSRALRILNYSIRSLNKTGKSCLELIG